MTFTVYYSNDLQYNTNTADVGMRIPCTILHPCFLSVQTHTTYFGAITPITI